MIDLEQVSFRIISGVGAAKSCYIEAIKIARQGDLNAANEKVKEGYNYYLTGHEAHNDLLTADANQQVPDLNLLLMHAEDQLMSAETIKLMAEEFIHIYTPA